MLLPGNHEIDYHDKPLLPLKSRRMSQVASTGVYEMYPIGEHGLLMGLRGSWVDDQTFLFEYDEIANNDAFALEIHFEGDHITIDARERTHTGILTLEGTLLSP